MSRSTDAPTRSPLATAAAALRRRGGVPLTVARGVKRGAVATQHHAEELADPVLRPVIATLAHLRGGPTVEEFLEQLRAGRHITAHRFGRLGWTAPRRRAVIPIDEGRTSRRSRPGCSGRAGSRSPPTGRSATSCTTARPSRSG